MLLCSLGLGKRGGRLDTKGTATWVADIKTQGDTRCHPLTQKDLSTVRDGLQDLPQLSWSRRPQSSIVNKPALLRNKMEQTLQEASCFGEVVFHNQGTPCWILGSTLQRLWVVSWDYPCLFSVLLKPRCSLACWQVHPQSCPHVRPTQKETTCTVL